MGFPGDASGKEPTCQCRRLRHGSVSMGCKDFPREGHGNPLLYSCLENLMDRKIWPTMVHDIAKNQTRLNEEASREAKWHSKI